MEKFWHQISRSELVLHLLNTPAPRWAICLVDMLIVAVSCALTFTFSDYHDCNGATWTYSPVVRGAVVVAVYFICSLIVKSYKYILRLSVMADLYRMTVMISLSSVILVAGTISFQLLINELYFRIWNIFLIAVLSFSMMMCLRLALKYVYSLFVSQISRRERVVMLGSAINSYFLASALKYEVDGRFEPVALISLSNKDEFNDINGIPVLKYDEERIGDVFAKYNCSTLVFLSTQIEFMRSGAADVFLRCGVKLLMLNQVEEFSVSENGQPALSSHVHHIKIEDLLGRAPIKTENPTISQTIRGSVVMITGAAGSIGSEIVRQVAHFGAKEIVMLDQAESPMHEMQLELQEKFPGMSVRYFIGSVTNRNRIEKAFVDYRPRYVFHAAAYKHVPMMEHNPSEAVLTNVFGTKNMADLSIKYGVEKFVMVSTDKAVNPTNIMGASKRIAEIYVQSLYFHNQRLNDRRSTQFITTRFGNVLGSNGSVIPRFHKQIENGGPVTVTHRDIIRYFMTIPEACSLVLEAGCMGTGGEIYIFDMGKPVKIYDLACRMISLAGLKVGKDIEIVETGLRPGEKLFEELLNDRERTMATHHPKIMIAKVRVYDYKNVLTHLDELKRSIDMGDNHSLVLEMKHIVPEYISKNSEWEKIDEEVSHERNSNDVVEMTNQIDNNNI